MIVQVNTATYLTPIGLRDADEVAVTDKVNGDFTVTAILDDAVVTVEATITHITNGFYSVVATFADTGTGTLIASVDVDGETIEDVQTVQVLTAAQVDPVAASTSGYDVGTVGYELHALFRRPVRTGYGL